MSRTFNAEEVLSGVSDWNGNSISFGYDRDGNLARIGYPNGVTETASYDKGDYTNSIADATSTATLASSVLTRDADSGLTGVSTTGTNAGPNVAYGYNQLGQVTTYKVGTAAATNYGYDGDDNLAALPNGTTQTFDAAHELTKTGTAVVSQDTRGNLTSQIPAGGYSAYVAYDQANRMSAIYITVGTYATYTYDGDGLRTSKTVNGTTSTYTWGDTGGSTPLLLSDGSTSYLYGPGGLPVEQINSAGTPTYLQHDQQGSTDLLTSSAGSVVGTYSYAPYGATTAHTGTAVTALRYDGQYADDESGLYYLRARYYNPVTGQFITRDPAETTTGQPYQYANDDPLAFTDPSGLFGCGIFHSVCSIASDAGSYVEAHPWQTLGYVAGGVAAVTGLGAIADVGVGVLGLSAETAGQVAVGAGFVASGADLPGCIGGSTSGCIGVAANLLGAGLGRAGLAAAEGTIPFQLLAAKAFSVGLGATAWDLLSEVPVAGACT
ncbi:MAG TPA: RHS repeat-associated core domain-containing protein [Mycobacteriales bacterium]|nr:RHS repeat-associated core domain-containing protein [Mycobacteriales bacterium]